MSARVVGAAAAGALAYPLFWAGLIVMGVGLAEVLTWPGPPVSDADPYGALAFAGLGVLLVAAACGVNWVILRRFRVTRPWLVAAAGSAVVVVPWIFLQTVIAFFSEAVPIVIKAPGTLTGSNEVLPWLNERAEAVGLAG